MLHYTKIGKGQAVLLIHGFPNDGSNWDSVLPLLSDSYQYIIPDLPGAGKSAAIDDLTLEKMGIAIKDILDKENIHQAIFVGHSMGGYTIMEATKFLSERMKAISLVHSLGSADSEERKDARRKSIKLLLNGNTGKAVFLKAMADNLFPKTYKQAHPNAAKNIANNGEKLAVSALAAFYNAIMIREDRKDWLKQNTNIPMQWIIGEEDTATSMKEGLEQCYLSQINDVQLYRGIGHMSMIECPARLAKDLNNFFDYIYKK